MISRKILQTLLIPSAALIAEPENQDNKQKNPLLCRPSELPIYAPEPKPLLEESKAEIPSSIEQGFATVREHVTKVYKECQAYKRVATDYVEQSKDNADWLLKYLRQEDNTTPKAGAIAIGALTGLIFGLRGRFIKRTLYATTGALGMAAVCYPKEASEYSQVAITEARKYATIAYNFAYGVKKDDPPLELPSLPKMPTSISEVWESVSKSATSLVSGGETEQVMEIPVVGNVSTEQPDAETVVSDLYESTSETCDCSIGGLDEHSGAS